MPDKKYDFTKILRDYNKEYKREYQISLAVSNPIVIHRDGDSFYVMYTHKNGAPVSQTLFDFLYYNYPSIDARKIKAFILYKESSQLNLKIKILPPDEIRYAYLDTNYFSKAGPLGSSCMRYKEMQKSLNFYIKNNVKIVVVIDNKSKIHARALLWENVRSTKLKKPFTYLDRVFFNSEHHKQLFCDLVKENKWKSYNSPRVGCYYIDNIDITGICHLPYTDTFRYLYYKSGVIAAVTGSVIENKIKYREHYVFLTNTHEGGYHSALDVNRVEEVLTGNHISKKDAVFVKRYEGFVLKKNIADINGDYYSVHDSKIMLTELDGHILKDNSINEVLTNVTMDKNKAIHSAKYNGYIHNSNVVYIKDELYHSHDTNIICFRDKWYHISQCFTNYNRKEVNKELAKQPVFFYKNLPETWVPYTIITKEGNLIPKEYAIIAYDLVYNPMSDNIDYQEVYCTSKMGLIQLITGELVVYSLSNKQHLKKFNNKYYIKREFEPPNKNQLLLFTR